MRKIVWSPIAFQDYTSIIDYLNSNWTTKEVQHFVDKVTSAFSMLENGSSDFKRFGIQDYRVIVIQKQVSIIYRNIDDEVQIIRIWDNRQNPDKFR